MAGMTRQVAAGAGEGAAGIELDPLRTPTYYVKRLAHELARRAEPRLRPLGVGVGSLPVLTALKAGQAATQTELTRLLHVEQPSMAQALARLERDGMVTRTPHPSNRRVQVVEITPAALEVLVQSKDVLETDNRRALSGFSAQEAQSLLAMLKRMHENLARDPAGGQD